MVRNLELKENPHYEMSERETVITTDDYINEWNVFTRQATIIRRMQKIGIEPYSTVTFEGRIIEAEYKVPFKRLRFSLKSTPKDYTDEERRIRKERMLANFKK